MGLLLKVASSLIVLIVLFASNCLALDKRVPTHISPYKQLFLKINTVYSSQETDQYNLADQKVSTVKNTAQTTKTILRYSPLKQLEIGLESIYFFSREQKRTNPMGLSSKVLDSSGLGDTSLQLTYLPYDSRQQRFGLLVGGEVQFPTGEQSDGLGSGSTDVSLRTTLSLRTKAGFPYLAAIYTWAGEGKEDGQKTREADDLFLGLGFKSRRWHGFSFDARIFNYFLYRGAVKYHQVKKIDSDPYQIPGARLEIKYAVNKTIELSLIGEKSWPENHDFTSNGLPMKKRPGTKSRGAFALRLLW